MSGWNSSRICVRAIASTALSLLGMLPSRAAEVKTEASPVPTESRLQDLQRPAIAVKDWLAQTPTPIEIIGVRFNQTASGLEVLLETTSKQPLYVLQPWDRFPTNIGQ